MNALPRLAPARKTLFLAFQVRSCWVVAASFRWNAPRAGVVADYNRLGYMAELQAREFATLEEFAAATGQDRNSVLVDYDVFMNVPKLDAQDEATAQNLYDAGDLDFRLRPGSAAIDRGRCSPP